MIGRRRRPVRRGPVGPRPVDLSLPALPTVGFWFNPNAPNRYPRPERLVGVWDPAVKQAVVAHLRAGATFMQFAGLSFCRFRCGVDDLALGSQDLTDGTYDWPSGLAHYVEAHDVRLPDDFIAHVLARPAPREVSRRTVRLDDGPWIAWGRAQGACVDLGGWEIPDDETRERIIADLEAHPTLRERITSSILGDILLCRGETREVVLLRGGAMEVIQVRPGGAPPYLLPDWDAWPML